MKFKAESSCELVSEVEQRMLQMDQQYHTNFTEWVTDPVNLQEIRLYLNRTLEQILDHSQLSAVIRFITANWPVAETAELIFTTIPFHDYLITIISDIIKERSFYDAVDLISFVCVDESFERVKEILFQFRELDIVDINPYLKHVASNLSWKNKLIEELYQ